MRQKNSVAAGEGGRPAGAQGANRPARAQGAAAQPRPLERSRESLRPPSHRPYVRGQAKRGFLPSAVLPRVRASVRKPRTACPTAKRAQAEENERLRALFEQAGQCSSPHRSSRPHSPHTPQPAGPPLQRRRGAEVR